MPEQKPPAVGSAREQAEALFKTPAKPATEEDAAKQAALASCAGEPRAAESRATGAGSPHADQATQVWRNAINWRCEPCHRRGAMPPAADNATWKEEHTFNAADAILASPGLKAVYAAAIKDGCAVTDAAP